MTSKLTLCGFSDDPALLYGCMIDYFDSQEEQAVSNGVAHKRHASLPAACACDGAGGVAGGVCAPSGQCVCLPNYTGRECDQCAPGHYGYPDCAGEWP